MKPPPLLPLTCKLEEEEKRGVVVFHQRSFVGLHGERERTILVSVSRTIQSSVGECFSAIFSSSQLARLWVAANKTNSLGVSGDTDQKASLPDV